MTPSTRKILILSHDATRTGAPILLLNLARLLKSYGYMVEFLLKGGGPLRSDFEHMGTTHLAFESGGNNVLKKIKNRLRPRRYRLKHVAWASYDLLLSNTITNGDILPQIKERFDGPILSYIHELEMGSAFFTNEQNLEQMLGTTDGFLVPSMSVKHHLMNNLKIQESKIAYLPYFIPPDQPRLQPEWDSHEEEAFTVGAVGTIDWRKSPEIFVLIASAVFKRRSDLNIRFKWQGAANGVELKRLKYDISNLGLEGKVLFYETTTNIDRFYESIDLFLLTSREDPYPLVVLEAANMTVPTLCFENTGGAVEFVENSEGGSVVPYLDIEQAAEEIIRYCLNAEERILAGENGKNYLKNTHQDSDFVLKKFEKAVETLLTGHVKR